MVVMKYEPLLCFEYFESAQELANEVGGVVEECFVSNKPFDWSDEGEFAGYVVVVDGRVIEGDGNDEW